MSLPPVKPLSLEQQIRGIIPQIVPWLSGTTLQQGQAQKAFFLHGTWRNPHLLPLCERPDVVRLIAFLFKATGGQLKTTSHHTKRQSYGPAPLFQIHPIDTYSHSHWIWQLTFRVLPPYYPPLFTPTSLDPPRVLIEYRHPTIWPRK